MAENEITFYYDDDELSLTEDTNISTMTHPPTPYHSCNTSGDCEFLREENFCEETHDIQYESEYQEALISGTLFFTSVLSLFDLERIIRFAMYNGITSLYLWNGNIDNEGAILISKFPFRRVSLMNNNIGAEGVNALLQNKYIETLSLLNTNIRHRH
jgi:hypothetical protein